MIIKIQPSIISGTVRAPASKSSMQRACAAALLKKGDTIIRNPGNSNDDLAAIDVIRNLGATAQQSGNNLLISSNGVQPVSPEINCGESGLGLRMFAPIAALCSEQIILNGSGSLLQRPMDFFDEIFPLLKIRVRSNRGKLPILIQGPMQPVDIQIDGFLSSQFLTGLLMAYVEACTKPVVIKVNDLKSKPYIDLTLQVMEHFGWNLENRNYEEFHFVPAMNHEQSTITYTIEGDWSGAAFLLVAGAIAGNVTVEELDINSPQGDKSILSALQMTGAGISVDGNKISVSQAELTPFDFDATDCPDLFPPLVALAAYCNGVTNIKGASRLAHKESNRSLSLQEEFGKMGLDIVIKGDDMIIKGNGKLSGAAAHSHHDHRIAMACAVAALKANGPVTIHAPEAVNKSYPDFYDHLQKLNANITKA